MSLKDQLGTDAITMLNTDELAIDAVYRKKDGSEIGIQCLSDSLNSNNILKGGKDIENKMLVHTNIAFMPKIYEKVFIDGVEYKIMDFDKNDLFTTLYLSNEKRSTGKNYGFRS